MHAFRLWIATRLLAFMPVNTCICKVQRNNGMVEWDGGTLVVGSRVIPTGLHSLTDQ